MYGDLWFWVDPDGTETTIAEGPGTWVHPRLSPDETKISLDIHTADGIRDVNLYDLSRGQFQQLTHTGVTWESEWTPDGRQIAVLSGITPGQWSLYRVRTDFSGEPELVWETDHTIPGQWIEDGGALLCTEWDAGGVYRVRVGEPIPEQLFAGDRREGFPRVSPNEGWMVYVADQASSREIFVTSYPDLGAIHKVSIDGGREPVWSHDGRTLYYAVSKEEVDDDPWQKLRKDFKDLEYGPEKMVFDGFERDFQESSGSEGNAPTIAWLPDSQSIAF